MRIHILYGRKLVSSRSRGSGDLNMIYLLNAPNKGIRISADRDLLKYTVLLKSVEEHFKRI